MILYKSINTINIPYNNNVYNILSRVFIFSFGSENKYKYKLTIIEYEQDIGYPITYKLEKL